MSSRKKIPLKPNEILWVTARRMNRLSKDMDGQDQLSRFGIDWIHGESGKELLEELNEIGKSIDMVKDHIESKILDAETDSEH